MNILIVGNGGREHALAWKAAQSPLAETVFVAPGNAGTDLEPGIENIAIAVDDLEGLKTFALDNQVGLTIVGPEVPLVAGIVDVFREAGLRIFGPSAKAAQLEGSKAFTKDFLQRHNIPTAAYGVFTQVEEAVAFANAGRFPVVIKADGLAAGKGVIIAQSAAEAEATIKDMLAGNRFGEAGSRVVIEEFLEGEEASFICMVDGKNILPMATSQDHKARDNGDKGPNTGGMGAYSPAPRVDAALHDKIIEQIIRPTVDGMAAEGNTFTGFLYAGLMISDDNELKTLEYNVRFGDPETQPIMMRLQSDLVALCEAAIDGKLDSISAEWDPRTSLGVVMAAGGYPDDYRKGDVIDGLAQADSESRKVFHAGTRRDGEDVVTNGGRVLCVVGLGDDARQAQANAYQGVSAISWNDAYYRTDIGYRAVARLDAES
ncbi:phosphoribosylamine--glycine ligase [Granulosicoccaceae sp. 1_MG-2023]|nr:phosphoribosylamine--glycine ligase [Granulosicoccaceae sp. 1_MG-2023]